MIENSKIIAKDSSIQATLFNKAIKDALNETARLPQGDLRIIAIKEILIEKTKTIEGVSQELFYGEHTVQNWIISFIKLVGRKAGF